MPDLKFEAYAVRDDGEKIYRLIIRGEIVRDGLTIDEVIAAIHDRDEESLAAGRRER